MKRFIIPFCLFILLFQLFQIIYSQRGLFKQKYDVTYWKDRFEHSQWTLPLSKRIIGDDGLYAYVGYGLINGGSLLGFDSEVPPLGKYFIGLSIKYFGNPLYYSIFFGLGSLFLFYLIGLKVFKNKAESLLATSVLFLDPLFFGQFWQSTLDICQLFFLLIHVLLLIHLLNTRVNNCNKYLFYAFASGISLGLFSQVKYPMLLPLIFLIEFIFFVLKRKKIEYLLYLIGLMLAILAVNTKFFLEGNSMLDFLKFQKYILFFYLQSQLSVHWGAIWQMIFFGNFPSLSGGELIRTREWWIIFPVVSTLGILASILFFFKNNIALVWKGFGSFILGGLFILTIMPSYPRYLVIILPFLYLSAVKLLYLHETRKKIILCLIVLLFGVVNSFFFLLPKSEIFLNGFYYNLSHLYFHDVYQENIVSSNILGLTREQFRYISNNALNDAKVKYIDIKELSKNIPIFSEEGKVKIGLTYKTQDLGSFYQEKEIDLIQDNGRWKIKWNWDIILDGFRPEYKVESQIDVGKRGSIVNRQGAYLAKDMIGYLLSVNPEKIDLAREQAMLKMFSIYGYESGVNFQNSYLENVLPGSLVPVMTLSQEMGEKQKNLLLSYPGVSLTPYMSRIFAELDARDFRNSFYQECCTRIYSSYNYHGISGPEQKYDNILWGYSGGRILIKDNKGGIIKVVFEKNKKDGKDVVL